MTRPPVTSLVTPFAVQRLILLHFAAASTTGFQPTGCPHKVNVPRDNDDQSYSARAVVTKGSISGTQPSIVLRL